MPNAQLTTAQLAALLEQTGQAHHAAYIETDGTDPEWAAWYSGHLQALIGDGLGRPITRSELVYLLLKAQRSQDASGSEERWTTYYADVILTETAN
jgi:hypothetical protein